MTTECNKPVWFDFDNTPHVLFLEPLLRQATAEGLRCVVTCRAQAQTVELASHRGIPVDVIGVGDRRALVGKTIGVLARTAALRRWVRRNDPALLVSCSRSAALAARSLGLTSVALLDYEHAEQRILAFACESIWMPDVLESVDLPVRTRRRARFYAGLKENLYLDDWHEEQATCQELLRLGGDRTVVVARPPAEAAHYAASSSTRLWLEAVTGIARRNPVTVLVTPRTAGQRARLEHHFSSAPNVIFLDRAVDGPMLVQAADLVIGGGGTMNREAAVLGVPAWSVFTGPSPAIDECLAREGRLTWLRSSAQVATALARDIPERMERRGPFREGRARIYSHILSLLSARGA